ncbi:MAG: hypothetical protein RL577_532, partial [Bacteroidota bacterium]
SQEGRIKPPQSRLLRSRFSCSSGCAQVYLACPSNIKKAPIFRGFAGFCREEGISSLRSLIPKGENQTPAKPAAAQPFFMFFWLRSSILGLPFEHKKSPDFSELCRVLQRGRDSNPRYAFGVYTLSRRAPSTTRTPLCAGCKFRGLKREFTPELRGVLLCQTCSFA